MVSLQSAIEYNEECDRLGLIPYACGGRDSSSVLSVVQTGNEITINGTSNANVSQGFTKILLSGHIHLWNAAATPDADKVYPVPLLAGHIYKLRATVVGGTRDAGEGSGRLIFRFINSESYIDPALEILTNETENEITYQSVGEYVQVRMFVSRLMTMTNLVIRIEVSDITTNVELDTKQNVLTFDNTPTENSTNPIASTEYYETSGNSIDIANPPERSNSFDCCLVPCAEGDAFTLTGVGSTTSHRLYCFVDSSGKRLVSATSRLEANDLFLRAPVGTAYLVVNVANGYPYCLTSGNYLQRDVGALRDTVTNITGNEEYTYLDGAISTASTVDISVVVDEIGFKYCVVACSPGDSFTITGSGGSTGRRLWEFVDANGTFKKGASAQDVADELVITAPVDAAYLVSNVQKDSPYRLVKNVLVKKRIDDMEDFASVSLAYHQNGIYMYPLSSVGDSILAGTPYTVGGITFTYVSGDRNKITLSLSGTAESGAYINLATGSSLPTGTKLWLRIDKEDNPNVYIRSTSHSANFPNSTYVIGSGAGVFRLIVAEGTELDGFLVTCAIQSAPSNEELERGMSTVGLYDIPSYYEANDYLTNKINTVMERNLYTTGDEFVFITDYHAHKNTGHSLAIINKFYEQAGISKVFCGGDIGTSTGMSGMKTNARTVKTFREITPEFYACVGNHEWKVQDSSLPSATYNLVYNYYISQMEQHSQSMSEFGDFWIDSKGAKIRYFFLNQNTLALLTDISLKWFIQELPKVPAGYGIVVVMHHAYHSKTYNSVGSRKSMGMLNWWENVVGLRNLIVRRISQILDAVRMGTVCKYALRPYDSSIARESNYTPRDYTSAEKAACGDYDPLLSTFTAGTNTGAYTDIVTFDGSAMNDGVYPIAIFCGHKHEDAAYDPASASSFSDMTDENTVYLMNGTWYRYDSDPTSETYGQRVAMQAAAGADQLSQTETVPPILVVLTTTDCYSLNHPDTDPTVRQLGTISEQAFDIVQIDTAGRKVYCTRIGAGSDRVFSF